jgi:hypothetical protein
MLPRLVLTLTQVAIGWAYGPQIRGFIPVSIGGLDVFLGAVIVAVLVWLIGLERHADTFRRHPDGMSGIGTGRSGTDTDPASTDIRERSAAWWHPAQGLRADRRRHRLSGAALIRSD